MNKTLYMDVLEKAQATLAQKEMLEKNVCFDDIRVSFLAKKVFRLASGVKRKLKRRLGK